MRPVGNNIDIVHKQGYSYAVSKKNNSLLVASMQKDEDGYIRIILQVKNISDHRIDIDPADVTLHYVDYSGYKEKAYVYTPEAWIRKIKNDQMWTAIAVGLNQGMESYNAGKTKTYASASAYGSDGSYANAYGSSTSVDYTKKAQVEQMHADQLSQLSESFAEQLAYNRNSLLQLNTLYPEQEIGGVVIAKEYGRNNYILRFAVDTEFHQLQFIPAEEE